MKKIILGIALSVLAMPIHAKKYDPCSNTQWQDAHLDIVECGGDSCYVDLALSELTGVHITAMCNDEDGYCMKWIAQLKDIDKLKIDSYAKVKLSREFLEFADEAICSVDSIKFIKS